jgi:putative endonuclease
MTTLDVGRKGEELAKEHLKQKGYKIIEQNYRTRYSEIDIVAREKDVLVIVEVRTKVGEQFGSPEDTLDWRKKTRLKRNAAWYAAYKKWDKLYRIDAICIVLNPDLTVSRLDHYESI